jgi:hypothetical protein
MHKDMQQLLNAYLDGELQGFHLNTLQAHLDSCPICRKELEELRFISDLLQAEPSPEFAPAERFVSDLTLRLPRRTVSQTLPQFSTLAWWLVPVGLLCAWFFVQTVFTLTNLVTAAQMTGLLGQAAHWLGGGQETVWYSAATSLFRWQSASMQPSLTLLNTVTVFGVNLVGGFLWQALIVLLYLAWLFLSWRGREPRLGGMRFPPVI